MIDLVSRRYIFLTISLLIIIPGAIAILLQGIKPGIDFTGGTRWEVLPKTAEAGNSETFKSRLAEGGFQDALVKGASITSGSVATDTIVIDLPGQLNDEEKAKLQAALVTKNLVAGSFVTVTRELTVSTTLSTPLPSATEPLTSTGTVTATGTITGSTGSIEPTVAPRTQQVQQYQIDAKSLIQSYEVGPTIGSELLGRAILAIAAAALVILIYLTVVFRKVPNAFRYGVCAIIALLHDVLVVLGVFAILGLIFGIEVDALFITAMLTVIGFSVHDTIVVFDRVRENIMKRKFERFEETVNYSLVQTLARSINTSVTVLLTLLALYLFGGASIKTFVLALLIGIASGTYSSIFNASMLLVIWENHEWKRWFGGKNEQPTTTTRKAATR